MSGNYNTTENDLQIDGTDEKNSEISKSNDEKVTKRGRKPKNTRRFKSRTMSTTARAATFSMKFEKNDCLVSIDNTSFIDTYFPSDNDKQLPYSRLDLLPKLLCCQYVLHTHQDKKSNSAKCYPFVFRLSHELAALNDSYLKKKIQRKLKDTLRGTPLFWMTTEHKDFKETTGKHLNGEILLYPGELDKVETAFKELFGLTDSIPRFRKDGLIKQKTALGHAIDFPIASRNKQLADKGEFYAVFNWVSYSLKYLSNRRYERRVGSSTKRERFHYISAELNKLASEFHTENIYKKSVKPKNEFFGSWA